jgi:DNA-directed RNA polymerase specialized sigma24 family protein
MSNNRAISKVANHYRRTCRLSVPDYQDLKSHLQAKMLAIRNLDAMNGKQLYSALTNDARNWLRKYLYHTKGISSLDVLLEAGYEPEATATSDNAILISQCLNQLTPMQRQVVALYFGLTDDEPAASFAYIADRLNVSAIVAQRLYRSAIQRLRIFANPDAGNAASCCRQHARLRPTPLQPSRL